ncbi:unnamed protein product [Sphenostylis stenocarpa]|uniref:PTM/DIR17-like Tudor domain-containing protein n=1 Tax=Sphenostylis stenocarpa TaxID=92480 RepID=A0AA86SSY9_9FABA|nr:unnamed protein product [Sphenostylis stenocarpa]
MSEKYDECLNIEDGATPRPTVNNITKRKENKQKHKAGQKVSKKEVTKNNKQEGEATNYKPRMFIGLYVCKEYNGARYLGTVISYSTKKKMMKIEYEDGRTEFLEKEEVKKIKATQKDILDAQKALKERNISKKTSSRNKKRVETAGESSTTTKKKNKASDKEEKPRRYPLMMRASNDLSV